MTRKRWNDLSGTQKIMIIVGGVVQIGLLVAAQIDIYRKPESEIKGPKSLWRAIVFVNYVGPIAYFTLGWRS